MCVRARLECEKASYLLKINRQCSAVQMFEGEAASQQALRFAGTCLRVSIL